jgi:hypothetical protein
MLDSSKMADAEARKRGNGAYMINVPIKIRARRMLKRAM